MSEQLLRQARHGDAEAFTALCAPYEGMVYRHCLQMLRNPADAQDAAQEAMLRAYRAMPRFLGRSKPATWLFRIAHNVCLDWLKRPQTRNPGTSLEALRENGYEPQDEAPSPEDAYLQSSRRQALRDAVTALPLDMQTLLTLRYGEGMSYEELANATGLNPGTVKSRLSRAKEKLHALLPAQP